MNQEASKIDISSKPGGRLCQKNCFQSPCTDCTRRKRRVRTLSTLLKANESSDGNKSSSKEIPSDLRLETMRQFNENPDNCHLFDLPEMDMAWKYGSIRSRHTESPRMIATRMPSLTEVQTCATNNSKHTAP
jgi:hypothetical protein